MEFNLVWNYCNDLSVLIPSSSGLLLEWPSVTTTATCCSLNPFFIRSAVGIAVRAMPRHGLPGLNPFFIRSAVGIDLAGGPRGHGVLIPSSSGLLLESHIAYRCDTVVGS